MELESPSFEYGNSSPFQLDYKNSGQMLNQDNDWLSDGDHTASSNISSQNNFVIDDTNSYVEHNAVEEFLDDNQHLSEEELQILAEQIAVERELRQMKEEGYLPMEDPPEYDVKDRIAQLNAELAAEGTIPDNRKQSVQFLEDPVTDVFPVIYYRDDEEDDIDGNNEGDKKVNDEDFVDQEVAKLTLNDSQPKGIERQSFIQREQMPKRTIAFSEPEDVTSNDDDANRNSLDDNKVVVEREGKFEVVDASDLSMEERFLMGLEPVSESESKSTLPNINNSGTTQPARERPSTATYSGQPKNLPTRRVQSARPVNKKTFPSSKPIGVRKIDPFRDGTFSDVGNENSRYGLTKEQKDYQKKMASLKRDKLRQENQLKEEEKRKVKSDCDQAFHAWIQQKEDDSRLKRRQERGKKKSEGESNPNKPNPDEVFKSWLEGKKRQSNIEKKFHKQFEEETKQSQQKRSREECEKKYKAWVRSKNHQLREQHSLSRAHALASKQQAQRSRKSRTLAKALQVAQTYRYTDYYGYRF